MSNGFELILLLYGLYQSLKEAGSYSRSGWARVRRVAPILYVFYRDGTIFYIPCVLSKVTLSAITEWLDLLGDRVCGKTIVIFRSVWLLTYNLALSIFGLIATVMQLGRRFTCANWEA